MIPVLLDFRDVVGWGCRVGLLLLLFENVMCPRDLGLPSTGRWADSKSIIS